MATQQFYVIVDLTGGVGGTLLYFIFPGSPCVRGRNTPPSVVVKQLDFLLVF